jgi:RNA polymerase sigma-70 factor (ECF subfamily)
VEEAERRRLQEQMVRLADGDREAFLPVFAALRPLLRRFAARHLGPAPAEDVAQEALLKVFARASTFDRERDALAWAVTITAYEIRTVRKRAVRRREEALDDARLAHRPDPAASPEEAAIATGLDRALDDALRVLAPEDAATLRDYASGDRPKDIAPATFRKRVERSLRRLRRLLGVEAQGASHDGR